MRTVGSRLHSLAEPLEQEHGIWIADDQTQEGIAEPTSSILARHAELSVNPDVADALALLIALADYLSQQWDIKAKVRQLRRRGQVDLTVEEGQPAA